jgi:hypothetical protein
MQVASLIEIWDASGNCSVTVVGGVPYVMLPVIRGWKNIILHLSVLIENPESLSHEKTCCAALECLSAVAL